MKTSKLHKRLKEAEECLEILQWRVVALEDALTLQNDEVKMPKTKARLLRKVKKT